MSDAVVVGITAASAAILLAPTARALRCNVRSFHAARRTAPLDGVDLSEATVEAAFPAPASWPRLDEVTDPREAAAYASLAEDALTYALLGDILAVVGGAALGVTLPDVIFSAGTRWEALPAVLTLLLAGLGIVIRMLASRKWEVLQERYLERHAELTAGPPPAEQMPLTTHRPGLLARLRGRLGG